MIENEGYIAIGSLLGVIAACIAIWEKLSNILKELRNKNNHLEINQISESIIDKKPFTASLIDLLTHSNETCIQVGALIGFTIGSIIGDELSSPLSIAFFGDSYTTVWLLVASILGIVGAIIGAFLGALIYPSFIFVMVIASVGGVFYIGYFLFQRFNSGS